MWKADVRARLKTSAVWRYGLAVVFVAAALATTYLLQPYVFRTPLFFLAIMISTWMGGTGPGLVAVLLATLSINLFLNPDGILATSFPNVPNMAVFLLTSLMVGAWSDARRRAEYDLRQARDELEIKVQERTADLSRSNEQLRKEIAERERAEEGAQLFRNLLDQSSDAIEIIDSTTLRFIDCNESAHRSLGYSREEFLSLTVQDIDPTVDRERLAQLNEEIEKSSFATFESLHRRKDGSVFPVEVNVKVIRLEREYRLAVARNITGRKRAEETLRQSESQLAEAQRVAHIGSWNWDLQSNALNWSDELYRIFGVNPQTFNPAYEGFVTDFVHAEDRALVRGVIEHALKTQEPFSFYNRIRRPDGEELVIHARGNVVSDNHGNPIRMFGTAQDVTERKRAEEALKESQRRLEAAQRIAHVGHYEHDLDTGVIIMSDENYRILGLQPQGNIPLSRGFEFIHPDDRERLHQARNEAVRTGQSFDVEYRLVRPDGEVRYAHTHTDVFRDEQGRARRTFGVSQDITERKLAEEALRQAEEKYHDIFEHAIEGIFQTTPDGQYITVNPALARMLGYDSPQELISSRTDIERQQYVEPKRRSDFKRLLEEHSVVQGFEYQAYRKDGSKIWLSDNGRVVRDESGAVLYYEGFTEDITERKLAEEALKKEKEILKKIFDNVPVLIGFVGEDGRVKLVNPEWERTMGWTLKELQEQDVDIFAEAYPDLSYRQEVLDFVAASTGEWGDLKIKVRDGRVIDAACAIVHLSDGTRVAIAQDITERKLVEEMLQTFSQRLIEAQEAERRRVARELHDGIGQALTAIKINLQAVQHSAGALQLVPQLNESADIVDRALQQVRDLSFNLRPSLLDDLGLVAALRWYVDHEAQRADLIPHFVVDLSDTRLPPELETACFRIAQEALTNVVRHAQAREVWVELKQRGAELHLAIRDDGIGFDLSAVRRHRSPEMNLGLQGMQERVLILGGRMEIQSAAGRGAEIRAQFPLTLAHPPPGREGDTR